MATDPRFERSVAEASGYVPSSLLAVPIVGPVSTLGVLEALDGRHGAFSLHDIDTATAIASAITTVVAPERLGRDAGALLARSLTALADDASHDPAIDAVVARAVDAIGDDDEAMWRLADRIARLRDVDPDSIELAIAWLDALLRHRPDGSSRGAR